jgi:PleD family two-component response regulator
MRQTRPAASISVGFAPLRPGDTLEQLVAAADAALYEVKQAGLSAVPGEAPQPPPEFSLAEQ